MKEIRQAKYDVMDIACFVVNKHNELFSEQGITNLRLQKLLYFIQAEFLRTRGQPCFREEIEAWPYGPVVVRAYEEFSMYGGMRIDDTYSYGDIFYPTKYSEDRIEAEDKECITNVIIALSPLSEYALVEATHRQDPWIDAIKHGNRSKIQNASIERYFNQEARLGRAG